MVTRDIDIAIPPVRPLVRPSVLRCGIVSKRLIVVYFLQPVVATHSSFPGTLRNFDGVPTGELNTDGYINLVIFDQYLADYVRNDGK